MTIPRKPLALALCTVLIAITVSGITLKSVYSHDRLAESKRLAASPTIQTTQIFGSRAYSLLAPVGSTPTIKPSPGTQQKPVVPVPTASQAAPKYSTSSDPRSTAYSTTPPPANPASFEIKITHAGQVVAGTEIMYNATKGERVYYGGDLVFNTSSVTISKSSGNLTAPFTVSTPDGAVGRMPSMPWDDQSPIAFVATNIGAPMEGSSWSMFVQTMSNNPPLGTYTVHISTSRSAQTNDGWHYDGFISVTIVP